jgi:hypothetical protein
VTLDRAKFEQVEEAAKFLLSKTKHRPQIAIICGTGLGGIGELITDGTSVPYETIPYFVSPKGQWDVPIIVERHHGGSPNETQISVEIYRQSIEIVINMNCRSRFRCDIRTVSQWAANCCEVVSAKRKKLEICSF